MVSRDGAAADRAIGPPRGRRAVSLALSTLIYEWRRYLAAVVALAFSGLLVLGTTGLFTGIVHSVLATTERSRADIFILPYNAPQLIDSGGSSLPARIRPLIYMNPDVVDAESMEGNGAMDQRAARRARSRFRPTCRPGPSTPRPARSPCPSTIRKPRGSRFRAGRRGHRRDRPQAPGREARRHRRPERPHGPAGGDPAQLPGRDPAFGDHVEGHLSDDRA